MEQLRPTSRLSQVLASFRDTAWDVIGALGTEQRSLFVPECMLLPEVKCRSVRLLEVVDEHDSPFALSAAERRALHWRRFADSSVVSRHPSPLLARASAIQRHIRSILVSCHRALLVDVSGLPKRYFFPLLREVVAETDFRDIVVSYTPAAHYGKPGEQLSIDPGEFAALPTFGSEEDTSNPERVVVAAGLQFLGLLQILGTSAVQRVKIDTIIPFPTPNDQLRGVRDFVNALTSTNKHNRPRQKAISPIGMWEAYRFLTGIQERRTWLLPFGPKPISVAMALAAIRHDWPVWYTQPRAYRPDYSYGVSSSPSPVSWAWVLRSRGEDFF